MVRSTRWSAGLAVVVLVCVQPVSADDKDFLDRAPEHCITTYRIKGTDVIDGKTIVFRLRGGDAYVNILKQDCPRLDREKRFMHETRSNQLCDVDRIVVLENWGGSLQRGASCQLGQFLPITIEEADELERVGVGAVAQGAEVKVREVELGPDGRPLRSGADVPAAPAGETAPESPDETSTEH